MFSPRCNLFLAVFTLGAVQTLSKPNINKDFFDDYVGIPGRPSTSYIEKDKCKKDILLIVDTSFSIGKTHFEEYVKPFLQKIVTDRRLNINRDGTQVAMMVFSDKTEMLLNFGNIYNKYELKNYIQNLRWDKISGDRTRTDLALEKANNEVFPKHSPENNRANVEDVVVLITDGKPRGEWNTKEKAIRYANLLKNKNVLIAVVPFGDDRQNFISTLQQLATSEKYTFGANTINEIDQFLDDFVEKLCAIKKSVYMIAETGCDCPDTESAPIFVKPGHTTATIYWQVPEYPCGSGSVQSLTVKPDVTSPHAFPVGKHTITYTYHLKTGVDVECPFRFEVSVKKTEKKTA